MAKVCPKCHVSQPEGVEFCPNDGSRLQVPHPVGHAHVPTLMGVGGDQAQQLAAALQAAAADNADEATQAFDVSALRLPPAAAKPVPPPPSKTIPPIQRPNPTGQLKPVPAPPRPMSSAVAVPQLQQPPVATTLARLIETSGALPTNLAVGRICDVADLLTRGRPTSPITPAHVGYADTTGSGKPHWAERGMLDPGYIAQYRPPDLEQGASPATDVYVLGCLLFEALTGKAPFRGKTVEEIAKKQAMAAAPAVRQVRVDCDLPPALEIELQRALKKRPGDRHASAAAFAEAIRSAVRDDDRSTTALDVSESAYLQHLLQGGQAPQQSRKPTAPVKAVVLPAAPPVAEAKPAPAIAAATPPSPPQRTGLIIGLVVVAALGIGVGAYFALRSDPPAPVAPAAPTPPPAPVPEAPDVVVQPDVAETPDIQPDVAPDVAPDVPQDVEKPKVKPAVVVHKPDVKPPEKIEPKPPEKKPDINRPPVF